MSALPRRRVRGGAAAGATLALLALAAACSQHDPNSPPSAAAAGSAGEVTPSQHDARGDAMREDSSGFTATDLKTGTGPAIAAGQTALVQYTGWLYSTGAPDHKGLKFDSSRDRGDPFEFRVGAGDVIAGWDRGVAGMQAGGERRLVIPPELGYGSRGAGGVIPPGATLVFDVELVGIR